MGVVFGFGFCPYTAVLFFITLMPLALITSGGITLPAFFAIGTGLPVIFFGVLISAGVAVASNWVSSIGRAEKWLRIAMALVFIGIGIYEVIQAF